MPLNGGFTTLDVNGKIKIAATGAVGPPGSAGGGGGIVIADVILTDTLANIPAPSEDGRIFLPSDSFHIYRDNGAAWKQWGPIHPMEVPILTDYTWVNQGGASATQDTGVINMHYPAYWPDSCAILKRTLSAAPYRLTAFVSYYWVSSPTIQRGGLILRESSSGKFIISAYEMGNNIGIHKFINPTTWAGSPYRDSSYGGKDTSVGQLIGLRIVDDGTDRKFYISSNLGGNWILLATAGNTDFLIADEFGFGLQDMNYGSAYMDMTIHSCLLE